MLLRTLVPLGACALLSCGGNESGGTPAPPEPRQASILRFEGHVYVDAGTSDFKIVERVRQQILSIFPGLRRHRVMVSRRDVSGAGVESFKTEVVTVVDSGANGRRPALRVRFRYAAAPEVAPSVDGRRELPLAVLHRTTGVDAQRVLRECSKKPPDDRAAASALAFEFDPMLDTCKAAIEAEQAAIDAARAKLTGEQEIPIEELTRLYIPVTVTLAAEAPAGPLPRYEPFEAPGLDPSLKPPEEIADPNPPRQPTQGAPQAPGESNAPAAAPQIAPTEGPQGKEAPEAEAVAEGSQAPAQPQKKEGFFDRFELPMDVLLDPKLLAVWLSLLMVYPILRSERKKKG